MVLPSEVLPERLKLVSDLREDKWLAHSLLFKKRHPVEGAPFHEEMVHDFHGNERFLVIQAFRDAAKSTYAEEGVTIEALYEEFRNCIIIGSSEDRAIDRLRSIKNELANNDMILDIYGNQVGGTWAETKIVLKNGVVIQAFGREQSLRGCKHLDVRPDLCLIDDLEDETTAKTEAAIEQCMKWVMKVLIPACQPTARFRMYGTPLHPRAIVPRFADDPEWRSRLYPIFYINENGEKVSSWPKKFSILEIEKIEARYRRLGLTSSFNQEYLCKAEDEESKPFKDIEAKVTPVPRRWQGVWACYDPARTVGIKSAQTGKAVWSWESNRLIIWEASGHFWKPDEIINDIMATNQEYNPIGLGVEKEGLEEFIEQPLRHRMAKDQEIVPLVKIKAPVGKTDFIKSLQPYFKSGEVILTKPMPDLIAQLKDFPSGLKDILNALAYALKMRPGLPVYEDFSQRNISETLVRLPYKPYWLVLNADDGISCGILCQFESGLLRIFKDWTLEGDTTENLKLIIEAAALEGEGRLKVMGTPAALAQYSNTGLRAAARQKQVDIKKGVEPEKGREVIRLMLRSLRRGLPEVMVEENARWVLRAFSGGFALEDGVAIKGHYRILMEGIESFAGLIKAGFMAQENSDRNYATSSNGQRYLSTLPMGRA